MDDRKDDLVPEWQTKPNNTDTTPVTAEQPMNEYRAFSEPSFLEYPNGQQPQVKRGSGLGITSFILGILGTLLIIGMFVAAVSIAKDWVVVGETFNVEDFQDNADFAGMAMIGLGMLAAMVAMFIGFILGIIGLLQKNRKKGFAIAGTIINGLFVCGAVFLFVIGLLSNLAA